MSEEKRDVEGMKEARLSDLALSGGSTAGPFGVWRKETDHSLGPSR